MYLVCVAKKKDDMLWDWMKSRFISLRPARLGLLYLFIIEGQCHTRPLMHAPGVLGCCAPVIFPNKTRQLSVAFRHHYTHVLITLATTCNWFFKFWQTFFKWYTCHFILRGHGSLHESLYKIDPWEFDMSIQKQDQDVLQKLWLRWNMPQHIQWTLCVAFSCGATFNDALLLQTRITYILVERFVEPQAVYCLPSIYVCHILIKQL